MKTGKSKHKLNQTPSRAQIEQKNWVSNSQRKGQFHKMILSEKRISDMQILNTNIKRKLSLYSNILPSPNQHPKETNPIEKSSTFKSNTQKTLKISQINKQKQKYTGYEKTVMNQYRKQVQATQKQSQSNPFEMALVEMIQKEQQMVIKRKKDLQFWQNRVKTLQQRYKQPTTKFINNLQQI